MKELTHIREQLAAILRYHTISSPDAQGTLALIDATGLGRSVIDNALEHGVVECAELVLLCQALDLDAASALAEAVNHVCPPLDLAIEDWPADVPIPYAVTKPYEENA